MVSKLNQNRPQRRLWRLMQRSDIVRANGLTITGICQAGQTVKYIIENYIHNFLVQVKKKRERERALAFLLRLVTVMMF